MFRFIWMLKCWDVNFANFVKFNSVRFCINDFDVKNVEICNYLYVGIGCFVRAFVKHVFNVFCDNHSSFFFILTKSCSDLILWILNNTNVIVFIISCFTFYIKVILAFSSKLKLILHGMSVGRCEINLSVKHYVSSSSLIHNKVILLNSAYFIKVNMFLFCYLAKTKLVHNFLINSQCVCLIYPHFYISVNSCLCLHSVEINAIDFNVIFMLNRAITYICVIVLIAWSVHFESFLL